MTFKTTLLILISAVLLTIMLLSIGPDEHPSRDDCFNLRGTVEKVEYFKKPSDVWITLSADNHRYILRNISDSSAQIISTLKGEELELLVIDHFSILDPDGKLRRVAELQTHDRGVLYSIIGKD